MKFKSSTIAVLCAAVLVFSLSACGGQPTGMASRTAKAPRGYLSGTVYQNGHVYRYGPAADNKGNVRQDITKKVNGQKDRGMETGRDLMDAMDDTRRDMMDAADSVTRDAKRAMDELGDSVRRSTDQARNSMMNAAENAQKNMDHMTGQDPLRGEKSMQNSVKSGVSLNGIQ